jgi:2-polyprenyl-6-hydroxyphenyl methylase/3-demethylubiquinone-9 3-methyltransferase
VRKVVLVLSVFVLIVMTVIIVDFRLESGSQPIARPDIVKTRASAQEYAYTSESFDYPWALARHSTVLPKVEEYLKPLPPNATVIDLGCGNGSFLANFRGRGWKLVGIDFSESGIQLAQTRFPDIRFEVADATEDLSSLGYGSFDAVISTEVIEHIFLPRKYATNCFRLLRPGGMVVMSTPYHGYLKNVGLALLGKFDERWDPLWDFGHIKFWSVKTLSHLLFEAGFDQVEWQGAGRFPHLWKGMVMRARVPQQKTSR